MSNATPRPTYASLRERDMSLRERDTSLREREMAPVAAAKPAQPLANVSLPSYSYLLGSGSAPETQRLEIPEERLKALLRSLLSYVNVDESWYLKTNPDVKAAVASGHFSSGREHYVSAGYFEDRWPHEIVVDEGWYLKEYPDVKAAISSRSVSSGQDHFNKYGFREGRLPSAQWSLFNR
jgi:hypothetical protein